MARHEKDAGESLIMRNLLNRIFSYRMRALIRKEFDQIGRDRRLQISLILPPVLQLTLFGFALSAAVSNVRLAVVDDSRSPESRELISTLTESKSFQLAGYYSSVDQLGDAVSRGDADAGMVVPYDYARDLARERPTTVQFLLNATNANTATISRAYAEGVIQSYNADLLRQGIHVSVQPTAASDLAHRGQVQLQPAFLFNPGLVDSWFIVTGVLGLLLILNSSLVASAAMVREREAGTIEQLLMSPASTTEIIVAKIAPLFLLLSLMMLVAIGVIKFVFGVPFHGGLLLLLGAGSLCILSGISIGTVIATFSKSAQQAQLTSFFINPPLSSLSGALNPIEAMPKWLQPLTVLNPVHHFATIVRGTMLKGSGFMDVWPNFLALLLFTLALVSLSIWRFRKQLS
jgi:ABC-2 type transport system permease protein